MSDIVTNPDGIWILQQLASKSCQEEVSHFHAINTSYGLVWFKFLCKSTTAQPSMLKQPSGAWIVDHEMIRKKYGCYRTSSKIYRERDGDIKVRNIHVIAGTAWAGFSQETVEENSRDGVPFLQSFAGWLYVYNKMENDSVMDTITQNTLNILISIRQKTITGHPVRCMLKVIQQDYRGHS